MIEYLEGLLEQKGQEQTVLELAEEMLKNTSITPHQVLAIQTAIVRARATSRQYDLAIPAGHTAIDLAKELKEWDYFGTVCLYLGTAYGQLGKHEDACYHLREYLQRLSLFDKAAKYQSNIWLNLGMFLQELGETVEASRAFVMAAKTSPMMKNDRYDHGVRQVLVWQLILSGQFDQVPRILVACSYYLRHNDIPRNKSSRLFQVESRVKFAWETLRRDRARAIVGRGLSEADGDYQRLGEFHMLTAYMAWDASSAYEAVDHAVTARYYARRANLSNLENEVTHFLYDTVLVDQRQLRRDMGLET